MKTKSHLFLSNLDKGKIRPRKHLDLFTASSGICRLFQSDRKSSSKHVSGTYCFAPPCMYVWRMLLIFGIYTVWWRWLGTSSWPRDYGNVSLLCRNQASHIPGSKCSARLHFTMYGLYHAIPHLVDMNECATFESK